MRSHAKPKAAQQFPERHERDAARRYLEHSHAAATLKGPAARAANRHATAIDEEHPRARDIALTGTARELGELPAHLRRHQREERERAGISTEQAAEIRRQYRAGPYRDPDDTARDETPPERHPIRDAAAAGARATTTAYSIAADSSWGSLIGQTVLWGMGLSIVYLLLTHDKAVSELFLGASTIARGVISPATDPLNPKGHA